jgi:endonuclease G
MTTSQRPQTSTSRIYLAVLIAIIGSGVVLYNSRKKQAHEGPGKDTVAMRGTHTSIPATGSMEIPALRPADEIVTHRAYTLSFNPKHEQANWVAYVLRGGQLHAAHFSRTNQFLIDSQAKPHSACDADYEGSGYDRGHLACAEDMSWSEATMKESFYYSNMSPQVPAFNRGVWKRLEELVRFWATAYDSIYVVTGPVLSKGLSDIGPDHVSVPKYYYKVILEYNPKGQRGIGFVLPNEASSATLRAFAVSIDSVEHMTGIDFFPRLPDDAEEKIESRADPDAWRWTAGSSR